MCDVASARSRGIRAVVRDARNRNVLDYGNLAELLVRRSGTSRPPVCPAFGGSRNPRSFHGHNFSNMSDYASTVITLVIRARAFRELGLTTREAGVGAPWVRGCCTDLAKFAKLRELHVIGMGQIARIRRNCSLEIALPDAGHFAPPLATRNPRSFNGYNFYDMADCAS